VRVRFILTPPVVDHQAAADGEQRAVQYLPAAASVGDQADAGGTALWMVAPTTATAPTRHRWPAGRRE